MRSRITARLAAAAIFCIVLFYSFYQTDAAITRQRIARDGNGAVPSTSMQALATLRSQKYRQGLYILLGVIVGYEMLAFGTHVLIRRKLWPKQP